MSGLLSRVIYSVFTSSADGLAPASGGGTDNYLRADGTWETPPIPPGDPGGVFGSGVQGAVTFNGSSTILGLVPSGNVYTLTSDIMVDDMTVNNSVTIRTAGFRIFVKDTLNHNGLIHNNGNAAASNVAGAATHASGFYSPGTAGANGGATNGSNAGASGQVPVPEWSGLAATSHGTGAGSNGPVGGTGQGGGGGGAGASNTGGNGGALTASTATLGAGWPNALLKGAGDNSTSKWTFGSGGGGGAGDGGTGGGGGGGAGIVSVCARYITGSGSITATGGAGAAGTAGNAAGGGGGGGGIALVIYGNRTGTLTITAGGGSGGAGSGTGGAGGAGGAGTVILINTSGDGT